ncbi:ATP-binding protein [Limnoraphis robusta]|uniref:ATP-binding protein n=2 Tax=Limnoraphis TaxID=1332112 RepID=A0ABU5TRC6_9CYAN|nr:ATP-binding protein [Limnoraphis robusta]MEA5517412.1 ATP-binding protein [Limnoraphis robusta CCNP1315]MEA5546000.1 ATP-binding protein [Limnoraphis robusta CCNP1324]
MVNNRLESFRTAFQNLQLMPLVTPEQLERFRVEYGTELLEELEQLVEDCSPNNNKIIFTGHRGTGKSTLLSEFCRQIGDRYFTIFFSISDIIEMSDVNHVNILFAMAVELMQAAEDRKVNIGSQTKKEFYNWFSKHTQTESSSIDSSVEIGAGAEVGGGAWFAKFFAKLKATLKANSVVREEITTEFSRRISDLVDRIDDIAAAIEVAFKQDVIVVIDDLDKLDLDLVDRVYRNHINALFQPSFRIIYTIPMAATRDKQLRGILRNATNNQIQSMWATKFFARGDDRIPDAVPAPQAMEIFEQILYKRIDPQLIEPELARMLILKSGGALRELIRLASQCCQLCLVQLRRTPDNQDIIVTADILQKAITNLRIEFTEPLGQNDYEVLAQVYSDYTPEDGMNETFLELLHNLYILEYRNDDLWFGIHPIVQEILQKRGLIH